MSDDATLKRASGCPASRLSARLDEVAAELGVGRADDLDGRGMILVRVGDVRGAVAEVARLRAAADRWRADANAACRMLAKLRCRTWEDRTSAEWAAIGRTMAGLEADEGEAATLGELFADEEE